MTQRLRRLVRGLRDPDTRVTKIGWASLATGVVILVMGFREYGDGGISRFMEEVHSNAARTFLGVASTVVLVDRRNAARAAHAELQALRRDLASTDPHDASRAARELRSRSDLESGALNDSDLRGAALSDAYLAGLVARRTSL